MPEQVNWGSYGAVLFDLDGVLTPTAVVHAAAWARTFNEFLSDVAPDQRAFDDDDYLRFVDGKPRYDGVRSFLASRDLRLPEGDPSDSPGHGTVQALGNAKNDAFRSVLEDEGVDVYPGSLALMDHLDGLGVPAAVVSSSANAREVLEAAGISDRFAARVDGLVARELGLPGKPAPDIFLEAADRLGVPAADAVVVEDAISGVEAGRAGSGSIATV
jgi:beta-phosphoglucomutase family hydrolase